MNNNFFIETLCSGVGCMLRDGCLRHICYKTANVTDPNQHIINDCGEEERTLYMPSGNQ